jgi:DNA repair ATPase RecN
MEQEGRVVSAIDKMREAFDSCTVMAGVENDFECVYITKAAAMLCLAEIDEENAQLRQQLADVTESMGRVEERCAKLRELVRDYERCTMHAGCSRCEYDGKLSTHCPLSPCFPDTDELRELGVEA